jgi:meso-butanediol dehydrogenase/(S,S)-butanediol dehydrogenase/diacetyl reductase
MDPTRLTDRVALVTGAASGIGRASAERLAREGARVLCVDVDADGCAASAQVIRAAGGESASGVCDVRDPDACAAAVAAAVEAFGRLDVLCNVAGIGLYAHATDISNDDWDRILGVNLSGVFYMCRSAIPQLLETRGNVVNMASSAGLAGVAYASAYSASKGGVVMLTRALAVEYAHTGLRVNCVCPGGVDTPLARGFAPPEKARQRLLERMMSLTDTPLARPEEIAALVAYLASDDARFVTGAAWSIDGGQVA